MPLRSGHAGMPLRSGHAGRRVGATSRPTGLVRRVLGATFAAGIAFGFRDALDPEPDDPIVIVDEAGEPPLGRVTLYFHPEVPEATLVLLR